MKSGNVVIVGFADISIVPSFTINTTLSCFSDMDLMLLMNQFYCNRIYITEKLQDYMLKIDS